MSGTVVACTGDGSGSAGGGRVEGELTVAAAASLTEAFTEIGDDFERRHPGTDITFSFAASSTLAAQIDEGAPADVFAAADEVTMDSLAADGLIDGTPDIFAVNELVIVTRPGNPSGLAEPADLADLAVVALCIESAPCGRVSTEVLDRAGVVLDRGRVTETANAKATLGAVTHGDADAALVYATDARAAGDDVHTVPLRDIAAATTYPIGIVAGTHAPALARAFVAHVNSPAGRAVLDDHEFLAP
jgi:molybdate transport system substrate-binding protein